MFLILSQRTTSHNNDIQFQSETFCYIFVPLEGKPLVELIAYLQTNYVYIYNKNLHFQIMCICKLQKQKQTCAHLKTNYVHLQKHCGHLQTNYVHISQKNVNIKTVHFN